MIRKGSEEERATEFTAKIPDHNLCIGFLRDPDVNLVGLREEKALETLPSVSDSAIARTQR